MRAAGDLMGFADGKKGFASVDAAPLPDEPAPHGKTGEWVNFMLRNGFERSRGDRGSHRHYTYPGLGTITVSDRDGERVQPALKNSIRHAIRKSRAAYATQPTSLNHRQSADVPTRRES